MTPRPRTASDQEILAGAQRALGRLGPARLTLADVAKEVGLAPATLLQRFGSKRGLLLALAKAGVESVDACFAAVRSAAASPFWALLDAATMMTREVTTPEQLANMLAFLQMDVSDRAFRKLAHEHWGRILDGYRALLDEAIRAGELRPCDTARLARAVAALSGGSLLCWAILRGGTAESWVRDDLDSLLASYRNPPSGSAAVPPTAPTSRRGSS
jgi:AcrR family transcriptional regulator